MKITLLHCKWQMAAYVLHITELEGLELQRVTIIFIASIPHYHKG